MGKYEVCSQGCGTGTETLATIEAEDLDDAYQKVRAGGWSPSACEDIIVRNVEDRIRQIRTVHSAYDDEIDSDEYYELFERHEDLECQVAQIRKLLHGEDARDIVMGIAEVLGEEI
jgi:hypothetical protein